MEPYVLMNLIQLPASLEPTWNVCHIQSIRADERLRTGVNSTVQIQEATSIELLEQESIATSKVFLIVTIRTSERLFASVNFNMQLPMTALFEVLWPAIGSGSTWYRFFY